MKQGQSIGEIATSSGLPASTLRYYESIGLLPLPRRDNGQRRYEPSVLQRLALIQLARSAGFSIAETLTLLHGFEPATRPAERWRAMAGQKLAELDAQIDRAQQMKRILEKGLLQCSCLRLEDCVIVDNLECQSPGPDTKPFSKGRGRGGKTTGSTLFAGH